MHSSCRIDTAWIKFNAKQAVWDPVPIRPPDRQRATHCFLQVLAAGIVLSLLCHHQTLLPVWVHVNSITFGLLHIIIYVPTSSGVSGRGYLHATSNTTCRALRGSCWPKSRCFVKSLWYHFTAPTVMPVITRYSRALPLKTRAYATHCRSKMQRYTGLFIPQDVRISNIVLVARHCSILVQAFDVV